MSPIYDASTLRRVSTDACIAARNRIKREYIPDVLAKINNNNFEVANKGANESIYIANLTCIGVTDAISQIELSDGLKEALEELGFNTIIHLNNNVLIVVCKW